MSEIEGLNMTAPDEGLDYFGSMSSALRQVLPGRSSFGPMQAVAVAWHLVKEGRDMVLLLRLDHTLF